MGKQWCTMTGSEPDSRSLSKITLTESSGWSGVKRYKCYKSMLPCYVFLNGQCCKFTVYIRSEKWLFFGPTFACQKGTGASQSWATWAHDWSTVTSPNETASGVDILVLIAFRDAIGNTPWKTHILCQMMSLVTSWFYFKLIIQSAIRWALLAIVFERSRWAELFSQEFRVLVFLTPDVISHHPSTPRKCVSALLQIPAFGISTCRECLRFHFVDSNHVAIDIRHPPKKDKTHQNNSKQLFLEEIFGHLK